MGQATHARAVTRLGHQTAAAAEIERRVGMRLQRQDLLSRARPPRIRAVMDEAVLRRPIGGAAVMRAQLGRLTEVARLPGVRLQVVPFAGREGGSMTTDETAAPGGSRTGPLPFDTTKAPGPDLRLPARRQR